MKVIKGFLWHAGRESNQSQNSLAFAAASRRKFSYGTAPAVTGGTYQPIYTGSWQVGSNRMWNQSFSMLTCRRRLLIRNRITLSPAGYPEQISTVGTVRISIYRYASDEPIRIVARNLQNRFDTSGRRPQGVSDAWKRRSATCDHKKPGIAPSCAC